VLKERAGIDPQLRAEQITLIQFVRLANELIRITSEHSHPNH